MLNCIIVDDENLALDLLEDNIKRLPFLHLVARCKNAVEAIDIIQQQQVDLVFTDIQMPGLNGIQLIQSLRTRPMFIMITAYEKYALDGFDLDVVDYLLKPVSYERFVKASNKAYEIFNLRKSQTSPATESKEYPFIFLQVDYSLIKIMLADIKYIEGVKDYIKIHYTNNTRPLLVRMSMKGIEEMLPANKFVRIHKSYIISIEQITAIRKNSIFLKDLELPVGELYKDAIAKLTHRNN